MDDFFITDEIDPDDPTKLVWNVRPDWTLPIAMETFGPILYKDYMIIFGGCGDDYYDWFLQRLSCLCHCVINNNNNKWL